MKVEKEWSRRAVIGEFITGGERKRGQPAAAKGRVHGNLRRDNPTDKAVRVH